MQKRQLQVTGMSCSACSSRVEKVVRSLDGVEQADVNLLKNTLNLTFDESQLSLQSVQQAVEEAGYGLQGVGGDSKPAAGTPAAAAEPADDLAERKRSLIICFALLIPLCWLSMGPMLGLPRPSFFNGPEGALPLAITQFLVVLPILFLRRETFIRGFNTLIHGAPTMDALVGLGATASMGLGIWAIYGMAYALAAQDAAQLSRFASSLYFEGAGMIVTLVALGKFFEARAKHKTTAAMTALMALAPARATVIRQGKEVSVPRDDVQSGERVVVKTGETIPVDGIILQGRASINEATITGESVPVEKGVDDTVTGATLLQAGHIVMRATRVGDDTVLAQIIRMVDEATGSKAPVARVADKVSGIFVPVVIGIAVLTFIVWMALGKSLDFSMTCAVAVLVISCPCALGLATPTAIMVGAGAGAKHGLLFKSAEALENFQRVKTVVFDKTGTLTEGHPSVVKVVSATPGLETVVLMIAAALEKLSEHPLGLAIVQKADEDGLGLQPVEKFTQRAGEGITGEISGSLCAAGNAELMKALSIEVPTALRDAADALANDGATPLYVASGGAVLGLVGVADRVKPGSEASVRALHERGLRVVMLTGDNPTTAHAIARRVGIDAADVVAGVRPADKARHIEQLKQQGSVAMVGDGVNDAPALALADVGVAVGAGTDVARASADVVLMRPSLSTVVAAFDLSRAIMRNIKQNLFWAFVYNAIGIPVAAGVFFPVFGWTLNPMIAAAAMSMSSVSVVSNALRLRFFKPLLISEEMPQADSSTNQPKGNIMEKVIHIEGMHCGHCTGSVEKALRALPGVEDVVMSLEDKTARIKVAETVSDVILSSVVTGAGFKVVSIDTL